MEWWHTIELPGGEVTPGHHDYRGEKGKRFLLPEDLTGKSVLDFGTWDGFWAIEAKCRGASEVVATDRWSVQLETCKQALRAYGIPYHYSGDLDFPLPANRLSEWENHFDVVLFYGILYHLKNPYMGLLSAASCCKPGGMVIVESAVNQGKLDGLTLKIPLLWVIDEVHAGDPGNYFMPNPPGLLQLCRLAGLNPLEGNEEDSRFTVRCRKEDDHEKTENTVTPKNYINYCNVINTEIQENDWEAAKLKRTLRETQRSLASLYASRSWRVTRPLRLIDNSFRWLRKSPALCRDLFAWSELRTTGWHGLILRLKKHIEKTKAEWHYPRNNNYTKGMVTIAILTKNRLDLIKPCIESIEKNLSKKYQVEILIGDRGSTDRHVVYFYNNAKEEYGNIDVIDYSRYSFVNNYNQLINIIASGKFLILLRNDMIVHSDWIDRLIDSLEDKHIGLVGGKIISVDNTIQHAGIEFNKDGLGVEIYKNRPKDYPGANYKAYVPAATLACAAMRHDVFDRFQLNEDFTGEAQDADFCLRLTEAGFRVLYNPEVEICHREGASRGWWQGYRETRLLHRKWGQRIQALAALENQRSKFDENEYKNSITIIRDDGIGDLLMGMSAFKKLKSRYPEKKLILLTYQRNIEMMSGFKIFDEFLPIPNREKYAPLPIPKDSQTYNFIDLEMVFGNIWGRPKEDNKMHRHLIYSRVLGLENSFELVPMPEYPEAKQKVIKLFRELNIDLKQKFVVLNLTATNPARSWWAAYYPKLIESIEEMGFIPLVVGTEDSEYFIGKKLINLINKTKTIAEYIEVIKLSKYVISTDTSAYHIAALSGIPFLAIFTGGIKPESRLTYYSKYEAVEPPADLKCHPCWDQGCTDLSIRWKSDPCRILVTPEVVIEKFKKLVETYPQD